MGGGCILGGFKMKELDLIMARFDDMKELVNTRVDAVIERLGTIENKMVTKTDCEEHREVCAGPVQKEELSIKKIGIIGGIVTGSITAIFGGVMAILKLFY